jgi:Adenomatosis polyposis coli down-regulated 1
MVVHYVLAIGFALLLSSLNLQTNPPALTGIWESDRCVIQERGGTRTSSWSAFVFLDEEWALEFIQYSDAACKTPALRAFFQGRYRVVQPSTVVQGAHDADFGFSRKRLTLYADALLAEANRGGCGHRTWARGREEDVSATGCLWVVPVSACAQEFDVVKVVGDQLFLGERPAAGQDLCREDRRARALRSLALVRRVRGADAGSREGHPLQIASSEKCTGSPSQRWQFCR